MPATTTTRIVSGVALDNRSMLRPDVFVITHALQDGHTVTVRCEGETILQRSTSHDEIFTDLDNLDEANVIIRNADGVKLGWFFVVYEHDQRVDEMVNDYSGSGYVSDLMDKYEQLNNK